MLASSFRSVLTTTLRVTKMLRTTLMALLFALSIVPRHSVAADDLVPMGDEKAGRASSRPILDDLTLAREYADYVKSVKGMKRYRVGFILVAEEAGAREWIAKLRSGADFAEVATRVSTHSPSAEKGGELGSFASCRWGKATLAILDALQPGQIYPKPVKGTHGWGIYRLESVTDLEPRGFSRYKAELLAGQFEPECPWEPPITVGVTK